MHYGVRIDVSPGMHHGGSAVTVKPDPLLVPNPLYRPPVPLSSAPGVSQFNVVLTRINAPEAHEFLGSMTLTIARMLMPQRDPLKQRCTTI